MNNARVTAKDFFLWVGAMIAFYWTAIAFIFLIFDYINYTFPNVLNYYPADPYQSGMSLEMASIIVLAPIYFGLSRLIRRDEALDPTRKELWIRRWGIILTLFVSGVAIAADVITLLTTFLNGEELTTAFLLKALVLLLVAGAVFMHFSVELRGYWDLYPSRRRSIGIAVAVLLVATIGAGFIIVGTPQAARQARLDTQRVNDLMNIDQRVTYYWQAKQALPATLGDIQDPMSYGPLPVDPVSGNEYEYRKVSTYGYEVCADFASASRVGYAESVPVPAGIKGRQDSWAHGAGHACFSRTIDPSFYPPLK